MHTLIVTTHPDPSSYTHAVVDRFIAGLKETVGNTWEIADLTREGFDPAFTAIDNEIFNGRATPGPDLVKEQERIGKADVVVLIFPFYWWSMPAILKGWIDRVFTQGWAYLYSAEEGTTRLLTNLNAKAIGIGGAHRETYERCDYIGAINKQIGEGIFEFCGGTFLGTELLIPIDEQSSNEGLDRVAEIGRNIQSELPPARQVG